MALLFWEEHTLHELARATARQISDERLRESARRTFAGAWECHRQHPCYVGDYSDDEFFSDRIGDYVPSKLRVPCPSCDRKIAPMAGRSLLAVHGDWRWVGLDHREPYTNYLAACGWCGSPVLFTLHTPQ